MSAMELRPGDTLNLTLYWQGITPMSTDYTVFVHLTDENDIIQAQRDSYPGAGGLPTSGWPMNTTIRDQHVLRLPQILPAPARLRVDIGLYDFATGKRLPAGNTDYVTLGYVDLQPRVSEGGPPNPIFVSFDEQIALVGFQFSRQVMEPGDSLELALWWEAFTAPRDDYVVFAHLVLPPDAVWAQMDSMPQGGESPTSTWLAGQRIEDHYRLTLPDNAPADTYLLKVGLYDPVTLNRLPAGTSDNAIVLGPVRVIGK